MCFAHDAGYSDSKKLTWIIQQDIHLKDRAYEIARNYRPRVNGFFFKKLFTENKRWSVCDKAQ